VPVNKEAYQQIKTACDAQNVTLVAVSKTKPMADIMELYDLGHRDFGENYVQELVEKYQALPKDIRWHFIGHLQSNKVKMIVPFVHLIHGVDSFKLLDVIDKEAKKYNKIVDCLLQIFIAKEETKFGMDENELSLLLDTIPKYHELGKLKNIAVKGFMGMASNTDDKAVVKAEFENLSNIFKLHQQHQQLKAQSSKLTTLSMGMSGDYKLAIEAGSNMVRIGSLLFGERDYTANK
jgi:pyridoxal phosphate enzyme (YggS family)